TAAVVLYRLSRAAAPALAAAPAEAEDPERITHRYGLQSAQGLSPEGAAVAAAGLVVASRAPALPVLPSAAGRWPSAWGAGSSRAGRWPRPSAPERWPASTASPSPSAPSRFGVPEEHPLFLRNAGWRS